MDTAIQCNKWHTNITKWQNLYFCPLSTRILHHELGTELTTIIHNICLFFFHCFMSFLMYLFNYFTHIWAKSPLVIFGTWKASSPQNEDLLTLMWFQPFFPYFLINTNKILCRKKTYFTDVIGYQFPTFFKISKQKK